MKPQWRSGFDLVLEGIGEPSLERPVGVLAPGGVTVLYGASTGEPSRIGLFDFAGNRGAGGLGDSIHSFGVYATDIETFRKTSVTWLLSSARRGSLRRWFWRRIEGSRHCGRGPSETPVKRKGSPVRRAGRGVFGRVARG